MLKVVSHLMLRHLSIVLTGTIVIIAASTNIMARESQQVNVSATPASISLPSPLPFATQAVFTPTSTYTPTSIGPTSLEALTEANVRAEPDPESELLGTIRSGDTYTVIGRYFRWYQFQYDRSPRGIGWVFDELVQIRGDETSILDLSVNAAPTTDEAAVAATNISLEITQTPGGILTATADALAIPLPVNPDSPLSGLPEIILSEGESALPTFTYPPEVALTPPNTAFQLGTLFLITPTPVPDSLAIIPTDGLPPIVPILALGGIGLIGLVVISTRR